MSGRAPSSSILQLWGWGLLECGTLLCVLRNRGYRLVLLLFCSQGLQGGQVQEGLGQQRPRFGFQEILTGQTQCGLSDGTALMFSHTLRVWICAREGPATDHAVLAAQVAIDVDFGDECGTPREGAQVCAAKFVGKIYLTWAMSGTRLLLCTFSRRWPMVWNVACTAIL